MQSGDPRASSCGKRSRARLEVESLEERCLLSVSSFSPEPLLGQVLVQYQSENGIETTHVELDASEDLESALARLEHDPTVVLAEQDHLIHISAVPNDPRFDELFAYHNTGQENGVIDADIDAPEAWDISTGSTSTVVAMIDTGIDYTHEDLYGNIWINQEEIPTAIRSLLLDIDGDSLITFYDLNDSKNQGTGKITDLNGNNRIDGGDLLFAYRADGTGGWANGISEDGDSYVDDLIGWNFVSDTNNPFDNNGHGTHVSGIVGAMGDNGIGVVGVNWKIQMMALKFLDGSGSGSTSDAVAALQYALSKDVKISNNSWSLSFFSQAMENAISDARDQGHIFVTAAGNQASDLATTTIYPAGSNLDNVVTVGASSRNEKVALFSNFGEPVDFHAPGLHIVSTRFYNKYLRVSGTSQAAAFATGAIALVHSLRPEWSYSQIIQQIEDNLDSRPAYAGKSRTGGRLNLGSAVSGLGEPSDSTGPVVVRTFVNGQGSDPVNRVRFFFDEGIDPASFSAEDISVQGPQGAIPLDWFRVVPNTGNKKIDVAFEQQTQPGTYSVSIGPAITDPAGNPLRDGVVTATFTIEGDPTVTETFRNANPNLRILDHRTSVSFLTVDQDLLIEHITVEVDITHFATGDLILELRSPDRARVVLVDQRGGSGNHFQGTVFDDESSSSIVGAIPPFAGSFRPEVSLATFQGKNARGSWQLWITDRKTGNSGRLHSWSITIEGETIGQVASAQSLSLSHGGDESDSIFPFGGSGAIDPALPLPERFVAARTAPVRAQSSLYGIGTVLVGLGHSEDRVDLWSREDALSGTGLADASEEEIEERFSEASGSGGQTELGQAAAFHSVQPTAQDLELWFEHKVDELFGGLSGDPEEQA